MDNAEVFKEKIKKLIDKAETEKELRLLYITISSMLNK